MQVGKKGDVTNETVQLIVAAAGVIVLLLWFALLYNPGYDSANEIRESYFEMLEDAVAVADGGGKGEFYMIDLGEVDGEDVEFYLVYFGSDVVFKYESKSFARKGSGVNAICVCSWYENKGVCTDCSNLDLPATYIQGEGTSFYSESLGKWAFVQNDRLVVQKEGGKYVFRSA